MSGINEIQSRVQSIQTRITSPPAMGQFNAIFAAQMAAANASAGSQTETIAAPAEGFTVEPLASESSSAPVYGGGAVTLGVMLGLTGPNTAVARSDTVITAAALDEYLEIRDIEARNGRLDLSELTAVSGSWDGDGYLLPPAAAAWEEMRIAAAADGIDLQAVDLYRTWESQNGAYQAHLRGDKVANVLPPGTSQHGVGLAVDVTNGSIIGVGDPEHAWLRDNAARFGWYPISNESWHWEFRGV